MIWFLCGIALVIYVIGIVLGFLAGRDYEREKILAIGDPTVQRTPVDSSNIASIGFTAGPPAVMEIEFKGGGVYQYTAANDSVVKKHHDDLMAAESKGRHFTAHIRRDKALTVTKISG